MTITLFTRRASGWVVLWALAAAGDTRAGDMTLAVDVNILQPITLVKTSDLQFGQIVAQAAANQVSIAQSTGNRTATLGAATLVGGPAFSRAAFAVTGKPSAQIIVTFPGGFALPRVGGGAAMTLNAFTTNTTGGVATLDAAGTFTLYVGAKLWVNPNQLAGLYSTSFQVSVDYQ